MCGMNERPVSYYIIIFINLLILQLVTMRLEPWYLSSLSSNITDVMIRDTTYITLIGSSWW